MHLEKEQSVQTNIEVVTPLAATTHTTHIPLFGIRTTVQTFDGGVSRMMQWVLQGTTTRYVSMANVYSLMLTQEDPAVRRCFEEADMVTADGMPIVWLQRRAGYVQGERVYGPDVMQALSERLLPFHKRHYFIGGLPGVAQRLAHTMQARYPGLCVAGHESPPIRPIEAHPQAAVIERINASGADVVWVGLGTPKQDQWMNLYRSHLRASLLVGVGAAFDFLSGNKPQAPYWMQRSGLEWAFRFATEPRRLARRYIRYNLIFMVRVLQGDW